MASESSTSISSHLRDLISPRRMPVESAMMTIVYRYGFPDAWQAASNRPLSSSLRNRTRPRPAEGFEIFAMGDDSIHCQSRSAIFSTADNEAMMRSTVAGARFLPRTVVPLRSLSLADESLE